MTMRALNAPPVDGSKTPASEHRGVSLYYRVKSVLEEGIRSGTYPPGTRLPSENDLCQTYRVSRATVREAIRELIVGGLVDRHHGKGSFVRAASRVPSLKFTGFLEDLYDQVQKVSVHSVAINERVGPESVLQRLGLSPGTSLTLIERARWVDGEPFAWTVNFLPTAIGRRIRRRDLQRWPALRVLEEQLGIEVAEAVQTLRAELADGESARHLAVPFASPILFVERLYLDRQGAPLQLVRTHYRADRYEFTVRLARLRAEGRWRWGYRSDDPVPKGSRP